jgi:hypothetical protein
MRLAARLRSVCWTIPVLLGLLAGPAAAEPVRPDWLVRDALRAVLLAMPEDSDCALHVYELRVHSRVETPAFLLCGKLEFADPEAGRIGFVLFYDVEANRPRRTGAPFFHGLHRLRGTTEPADLCTAAEEQALAAQWTLGD